MAKRRRKAAAREVEEEREDEQAGEEQAEGKAGSFFDALGAGIKAAGHAAERIARMGVGAAELEKMRLDLRIAQSRLGEAVMKCWDAAPDVGVTPADPAIKESLRDVKDLRRKIREMEQKIAGLRQSGR